MSDIKVTPGRGLRITYTGKLNPKEIIEEVISILDSLKYTPNKDKHIQKSTDTGIEVEYRISGEKEVTDFYMYKIKIRLFFQHIKKDQGNVDIQIQSFLIPDYQETWQSSKLKNALLNIYLNHLKKDEVETYWAKLYNETDKIREKIKSLIK